MPAPRPPELRPLLVECAIRWLPADEHATMHAVAAGTITAVEPLVITRDALLDIEAHLRAARSRAFGILHGAIYRCPRMRLDYLLVDGAARGDPLADTPDVDVERRAALSDLIERVERGGAHAVGWYRGGATVYPRIGPRDVATHADLFPQRWPVALLREGPGTRAGACMRLSPEPRRPYLAPFHELLPTEPRHAGDPLKTAVTWTNYHTDAFVEPSPELIRMTTPVPFLGTSPRTVTPPNAQPRVAGRAAPFVPPSPARPLAPSEDRDAPAHAAAGAPPAARPASPNDVPPPAAEPVRHAPSPVDLLFDAPAPPPPSDQATPTDERRPPPPRGWRDTSTLPPRHARRLVILALGLAAIAGTLFAARLVDRANGITSDAAMTDASTDTSGQDTTASAAALATDSAASMATFAAGRLDESVANLTADLRLVAAALDTSETGSLAPGGCTLADSAHTRALLDLDAINLAQRYLTRPLDAPRRQRIEALAKRVDAAAARIRLVCATTP